MAKLDAFFKLMVDQGASDLHLVSGSQPILRVSGELQRVRYTVLESDDLKKMLYEVAPEYKIKQFEETGDVDFAYEIPGLARYRANYFVQKYGVAAVFRQIPDTILTVEQLGLPPVLNKLPLYPKGLVLVTGPTGSGKSTTLAALVDYANTHRKDHILTIEDPVEFVHKSRNCIVNHREVGLHTRSFTSALRAALREDPDIIMVGEMRDLETISLAVEAASTGHLVFGTLHTQSAAKTVDRIIDVFPHDQQEQIRATLADSCRRWWRRRSSNAVIREAAVPLWKFSLPHQPSATSYATARPSRSPQCYRRAKNSVCSPWTMPFSITWRKDALTLKMPTCIVWTKRASGRSCAM